jgi:hypothetical protein
MVISAMPMVKLPLLGYQDVQKLVEQLQAVGKWLRCLPVILYFWWFMCVTSISSALYRNMVERMLGRVGK